MNKSKVNSRNPKLKNPISVFLNILSYKEEKKQTWKRTKKCILKVGLEIESLS